MNANKGQAAQASANTAAPAQNSWADVSASNLTAQPSGQYKLINGQWILQGDATISTVGNAL